MNKLTPYAIDDCEQGQNSSNGKAVLQPSSYRQSSASRRSFIYATLAIFMFNVCLLGCGYVIYLYVNTLHDAQRVKISNFCFSIAGIVLFVLLLLAGDISKNKPNFYNI